MGYSVSMQIIDYIKRIPFDLGQGHYRHKTKAKLIAFSRVPVSTAESTALDFGCGDGFWSQQLQKKGYTVTSTDNYDFRYAPAQKVDAEVPLPFADNTFNLVWCSEVIEHVHKVEQLIGEFRRVLKPEGVIVCTTPNSAFWIYAVLNLFGFSPKQVQNPDHKQFFSIHSIRSLFPRAEIKGFFPYNLVKLPIRHGIGLLSPTFVIVETVNK